MRSSFGQLAAQRRAEIGISLQEFADRIGVSHARISQLEHSKANISDEVISGYLSALEVSGDSTWELKFKDEASFSNTRYMLKRNSVGDDKLVALLANYARLLSDSAKKEIESIIRREAEGKDISEMLDLVSSVGPRERVPLVIRGKERASKSSRKQSRSRTTTPEITPDRFAQLVVSSEQIRARHVAVDAPLRADRFLEKEMLLDDRLDVEIVRSMPKFAEGAYAVIVGHTQGSTIFVEQGYYKACALLRNYFANHVLLHEYAHHFLHSDLLETKSESYLTPHRLSLELEAGGFSETSLYDREFIGSDANRYIIPDSTELEAELFATLLAVPWMKVFAYGKEGYDVRTLSRLLARDHRSISALVAKISRYLAIPAVVRSIKSSIAKNQMLDHPFLRQ